MRRRKRPHPTTIIPFLLTCAMLLGSGQAVGSTAAAAAKSAQTEAVPFVSNTPEQYVSVCSNGRYTLNYCEQPSSFSICNAQTGETVWNSIVTRDIYDLDMTSATWKNYMQALLLITFAAGTDYRGDYISADSSADTTEQSAATIPNGLRITYTFTDAEIQVTLDVVLDSSGLKLSIPYDGIHEGKKYMLYTIELLPFFGAAGATEDGYMVYPDGNGAITYFNKTANKQAFAQPISLDIYGSLDQENILSEKNTASASLPAFGIKKGGSAFLAAITQGDTSARILVNPSVSSSAVALNHESFEFFYRNQYRIYLSNLVTKGKNSSTNLYGKKLDKSILAADREVKLFFLEGDDANYSGMANVYRSFLLQNGILKKSPLQNSSSLALEFFMGAEQNDSLLKSMVVATAYKDVVSITKGYLDGGIGGIQVTLRGWNTHGYGYAPQTMKPAAALGGKKGLQAVDRMASQNPALSVFLETDVVHAAKGTWGFSKGRDVLVTPNGIPVTNNEQTKFILTPKKSLQLYQKLTKQLGKYGSLGKALASIGTSIYNDYNSRSAIQRSGTAETWQEIAKSEKKPIAVQGGNLYLLASAQRLYDIETEVPMRQITDEQIPWFQMIVYNSIPYTAEPGNISHDLQQMKLKWIEYGCVPYFELTQNSPSLLKDTGYTKLFTSENSRWEKPIESICAEWNAKLAPIRNTYMVRHERLENGVVEVAYQNGYRVLINYSNEEQLVEGRTISPESYIVLGGSGQ